MNFSSISSIYLLYFFFLINDLRKPSQFLSSPLRLENQLSIQMLKERTSSFVGFDNSSNNHDHDNDIYDYSNNSDSTILKQELDKWYNFSFVLRKKNRILFEEILRSSYRYPSSINAKGKENSPESLFITLIFEQYKKMILNSSHNHLSTRDL
jgi:hypothetical protein